MEKNKFFTKDVVICIIILVVLLGGKFLLPKSGDLVLLDEVFDVFIVVIILGYIIYKSIYAIKNKPNSKKGFIIFIIILCLGVAVFFSKNLILDVINEPSEIRLYDYKVTKRASGRILDFQYYVDGEDSNGNRYMMEISSDDANKISRKNSDYVYVKYYKNTERVVSIN